VFVLWFVNNLTMQITGEVMPLLTQLNICLSGMLGLYAPRAVAGIGKQLGVWVTSQFCETDSDSTSN
jgi:hypothetical protein